VLRDIDEREVGVDAAQNASSSGVGKADASIVDVVPSSLSTSEAARDPQDLRDQRNRIWAHSLHQDEQFMQRSNFFLVAESLLVVAYSSILARGLTAGSSAQPYRLLLTARVIGIFGLLLTVIWAYSNNRMRLTSAHVAKRARDVLPEYQQTLEERKLPGGRISATWMITFLVPLLAGIMWLMFLFIAL
jgi:hypothetical protein